MKYSDCKMVYELARKIYKDPRKYEKKMGKGGSEYSAHLTIVVCDILINGFNEKTIRDLRKDYKDFPKVINCTRIFKRVLKKNQRIEKIQELIREISQAP